MKVPLRFQITEYDCGTVSLLNAFSYLFDREELPALLVKQINKYTLDCYDENGNLENIKTCLNNNGVVLMRCYQTEEHYVIITKIKNKKVYIFDPYYFDKNF